MRKQTPEEILANMRTLKKWIQARMYEFDSILKMKKDLEYYQHQTAQLMVRVDSLERKIKDFQTQP